MILEFNREHFIPNKNSLGEFLSYLHFPFSGGIEFLARNQDGSYKKKKSDIETTLHFM